MGLAATASWAASSPLYFRNFSVTGTAREVRWDSSVQSTLGTAWRMENVSANYNGSDVAPNGVGQIVQFPSGEIGYPAGHLKTWLSPTVRDAYILSSDSGSTWYRGASLPPMKSSPGFAGTTSVIPDVSWYDESQGRRIGYALSNAAVSLVDGDPPAWRLYRRLGNTASEPIGWGEPQLWRNITLDEVARTVCTGLPGDWADPQSPLGRCHLGSATPTPVPALDPRSLANWHTHISCRKMAVIPPAEAGASPTVMLWLRFGTDSSVSTYNGRSYWTLNESVHGPSFMQAVLRTTNRGATFELINTDATNGLGRDRFASIHETFIEPDDADDNGPVSAMAWTSAGEVFASGVFNWRVASAWSFDVSAAAPFASSFASKKRLRSEEQRGSPQRTAPSGCVRMSAPRPDPA